MMLSWPVSTLDWLQRQGVEVLALAHHQVCTPPPNALALVNPQLARELHCYPLGRERNMLTVAMLNPEAGCGTVCVGQDARASGHHRLASIDLRHLETAPLEARADPGGNGLVLDERPLHDIGDDDARQVVIGGAEPPAADEQIDPLKHLTDREFQVSAVVAHDALERHPDAEQVQLLGDEQRVGIDLRRREHLASNGDDPGAADWLHVNQTGNRRMSPQISRFP